MILESRRFLLRKIIFILVLGLILLSGCSNDGNTPVKEDEADNDYALSSDDIVEEQGKITNLDIFEQFVNHVDDGQQDKIRIVRYTTEGDPILQDLEYDTEKIIVTNDTTRDQYGDGDISTTFCKSISKNNIESGIEYNLNECDNPDEDSNILVVEK